MQPSTTIAELLLKFSLENFADGKSIANHHRIENTSGGLVCDSELCDFEDASIDYADYPKWINKPCPKCSANLLTEEDCNNAVNLNITAILINSLSEEQCLELSELTAKLKELNQLPNNEMFANAIGKELLETEQLLNIQFSTHKGIAIKQIIPYKNETEPTNS